MSKIKIILTTIGTRCWVDEPETEETKKKDYRAEAFLGKVSIKTKYSDFSKEDALGKVILDLNGVLEDGLEIEEEEEWK